MYINYKPLAVFLRMIIAMGGTLLLVARIQPQLSQLNYYSTIITLLIVIYYYMLSFWQINNTKKDKTCIAPWLKGMLTLSSVAGCAVTHFLINDNAIPNWSQNLVSNIITYLLPAALVIDWLLFDKKGNYKMFFPFIWCIPAALYTVYVYITVLVLDKQLNFFDSHPYPFKSPYPYPFFDIAANGTVTTVATLLMLAVCFIALGFIIYLIDMLPVKFKTFVNSKKSSD